MKKTSVEWLSNQTYELFEQYSEGKFDRVQLNKLMVDATNQALEKHEREIRNAWLNGDLTLGAKNAEQYYKQTYKQD